MIDLLVENGLDSPDIVFLNQQRLCLSHRYPPALAECAVAVVGSVTVEAGTERVGHDEIRFADLTGQAGHHRFSWWIASE